MTQRRRDSNGRFHAGESINTEDVSSGEQIDPLSTPPPALDTASVPMDAIRSLQAEEDQMLKTIRAHQIDAAAARAVTYRAGGTSPVQIPNPNACPACNAPVSTYMFGKFCNACGRRSDGHKMEPYE